MNIRDFSDEIALKIINKSSIPDQASLGSTCRAFYDLTNDRTTQLYDYKMLKMINENSHRVFEINVRLKDDHNLGSIIFNLDSITDGASNPWEWIMYMASFATVYAYYNDFGTAIITASAGLTLFSMYKAVDMDNKMIHERAALINETNDLQTEHQRRTILIT